MFNVIFACLFACLLLFDDATGYGLKRMRRDAIGRSDNGQGFYVRDRGHKNCEGLWKRCMQIDEGTSKRNSCIRGYNRLWCKDQPCPSQAWCEEEKPSGSEQNGQE